MVATCEVLMTDETIVQEPEVQAQEQQTAVTEQVETKPEVKEDVNWKKANEVLRLQKQEIDELKAQLKQINQPPPQEEKDELADLEPDDYLTVSKARSWAEKLAEKKAAEAAKKIVQEYAQQQSIATDEQRMRSKYEDYDYVIENFAAPMIKNDPALAYKIQTSKNPAETAYRLGKLSDTYEETTVKQITSPKAEKILKNSSRPVSSNAAGIPLKNQAEEYSKLSPSQIWEMSQKYARGA